MLAMRSQGVYKPRAMKQAVGSSHLVAEQSLISVRTLAFTQLYSTLLYKPLLPDLQFSRHHGYSAVVLRLGHAENDNYSNGERNMAAGWDLSSCHGIQL